jgi:hypothetical protein
MRAKSAKPACLGRATAVKTLALALTLGFATLAFSVTSANAATASAGFTIESFAAPTNFSAAGNTGCEETLGSEKITCDRYEVTVTNAGSLPTAMAEQPVPITIADTLPAGLTVQKVELIWGGAEAERLGLKNDNLGFLCKPEEVPVQCQFPGFLSLVGKGGPLAPDETLKMIVYVTVNEPEAPGPLTNAATVSGGGAPEAETAQENQVSSTPAAFGLSNFDFYIAGTDGARDTQAGGHPYEMTTTIALNNTVREGAVSNTVEPTSVQDLKDVVVDLPLGFAASTLAAPQCTLAQLSSSEGCPPDTRVGYLRSEPVESADVNSGIYNLVPEHGIAGEFGYVDELKVSHVIYARVVPTPAGYVLQATNVDIPQVDLARIVATFYGDPAKRDATSDPQVPYFTNPSGCTAGELTASIHVDSWQNPGSYNADGTPNFSDPAWVGAESKSPPVTGCNALSFTPELKAEPTTREADSPSGLEFELKLPQHEEAETTATPALKTATVTLPEGMTVDPSSGSGLGVCSPAQIGWEGGSQFNFSPAEPTCPESSKIGTLELETPLIRGTLTGDLYLATENENPFHSVLGGYVVVDDPVTGVLIKIAGEFTPNPQTGRITAVFSENPQLPFSDLKLHFFGGPRAELMTPQSCGTYTVSSNLEPWSAPDSGLNPEPFDSFPIESGCVSGFHPAFTAGSTNLQAGAYSTFEASFSREDTDQELEGLSVSLPPGMLADVGSVPECGEAQANSGTCPESTQVGTVEAYAGPGPNPLFVGGKAFLTGPYNGGPYGLSVVVPAIAGPFNFGNVIVRQSLRIDPTTAAVTDVSDRFPTILDVTGANGKVNGIPIRLRRVDVNINRPGFTFNPTNCGKLQVTGSITSTQGESSSLATPFQVTNCATLKFQPTFAVSTAGKTSKADGASLSVKLTYPKTAQGVEANITRVKVDLPKQLPSRLKPTLQNACLAKVFETNPAACPADSVVGHARAITPILSVPVEGPAYFVSHGNEAFPSLIVVLQGDGITVDLVGTTFISKAGITSSTFKTVPDVPVSTFELTLPTGPHSALAANLPEKDHGNMCDQTLTMPTEFVAQNGAKINESTAIGISSCAKSLTRPQKLAAALKACHKKKGSKRTDCEKTATKKYAPATPKQKKK